MPVNVDNMNINLNYNSKTVNISTTYSNGLKNDKIVSISDLVENIINSVSEEKLETIISPLLSERKGITIIQSKHIGRKTSIYILKRKKDYAPMPVHNREYPNVGIPALLFGVKVLNNRVISLYVACVKDDDIINYNTQLYAYPYSNVSESGHVCTGSNVFSPGVEDDNLKKLYEVPNFFLSMPNTGADYNFNSNTLGVSSEELIRIYENKEFDDDLLVPSKSFKIYKDFINKIV